MSMGKRMTKDAVAFVLPTSTADITAAEERLEVSCIRQAKQLNNGRIPGPGEFTSTLTMAEGRGMTLRLEVTYEWTQPSEEATAL